MKQLFLVAALALLAGSLAQDEGEASADAQEEFQLVPYVSAICKRGCPSLCQTLRSSCVDISGSPFGTCDERKARCVAACTHTCTCIDKCGPDCDTVETNCQKKDIKVLKGVFCPAAGARCRVTCVVECPQKTLLMNLEQAVKSLVMTVEDFVKSFVASVKPKMISGPDAGGDSENVPE